MPQKGDNQSHSSSDRFSDDDQSSLVVDQQSEEKARKRTFSEDSKYSESSTSQYHYRDGDSSLLQQESDSREEEDDDDQFHHNSSLSEERREANFLPFHTSTIYEQDDPPPVASDHRRRTSSPNFRCAGLVLSFIMSTVLLALSGLNVSMLLIAGESRRIETPILSRHIQVTAPYRTSLSTVVYHLEECPPLTGPPLVLNRTEANWTLEEDQYEIDSFFLNTGSVVSVNVSQINGQSKIYILEGDNALRRLKTPGTDDDPFGKDSVVEGAVEEEGEWSSSYTVKQSDIYTIAFDNPSLSEPARLKMNYSVQMTTYNLQKYTPVCSDLDETCQIHSPSRGSCLLVQASDDTEDVVVKIHSSRRWFVILLLSIIPYFAMSYGAIYYCAPKAVYRAVDFQGPHEDEPSSSSLADTQSNNNDNIGKQRDASPVREIV